MNSMKMGSYCEKPELRENHPQTSSLVLFKTIFLINLRGLTSLVQLEGHSSSVKRCVFSASTDFKGRRRERRREGGGRESWKGKRDDGERGKGVRRERKGEREKRGRKMRPIGGSRDGGKRGQSIEK